MAAGDLSEDQKAYVSQVVATTGLAPSVVTAWVGTESGWGVTKADHNYLNVGPGEGFTSAQQAANRVGGLINSPTYADIKASIPSGAAAQVAAIGSSRWGTKSDVLSQVASELGATTGSSSSASSQAQTVGKSVLDDFLSPITDPVANAITDLGHYLITGALTVVFSVAALGLIAFGLMRLTGKKPSDALGLAGSAGTAASMATKVAAI